VKKRERRRYEKLVNKVMDGVKYDKTIYLDEVEELKRTPHADVAVLMNDLSLAILFELCGRPESKDLDKLEKSAEWLVRVLPSDIKQLVPVLHVEGPDTLEIFVPKKLRPPIFN